MNTGLLNFKSLLYWFVVPSKLYSGFMKVKIPNPFIEVPLPDS